MPSSRPPATPGEQPPSAARPSAPAPGEAFTWHSESDAPAPARLSPVDDRLNARRGAQARAARRAPAVHRRLPQREAAARRDGAGGSPARREPVRCSRRSGPSAARGSWSTRRSRASWSRWTAHYRLGLARAPDVAQACRQVWGEPEAATTVVPLKQLLGMLGAAEWRRKGLAVPGSRACSTRTMASTCRPAPTTRSCCCRCRR